VDGSTHFGRREPIVLWKIRDVTCTCSTFEIDDIEICLAVGGVVIHREVFTDPDTATQYAIDAMRGYRSLS
jgi:hypothetical protein